MAKETYTAETRFKHNGTRYMPGDQVEMTASEAEAHVKNGVLIGEAPARKQVTRRVTGRITPPATDELAGISFASPQASLKAKEYGLSPASFDGEAAESENGYTVADVERIAEKETSGGAQ